MQSRISVDGHWGDGEDAGRRNRETRNCGGVKYKDQEEASKAVRGNKIKKLS